MRITVELPAPVHRDLVAYAAALSGDGAAVAPAKLVAPMLARFMAADREFARIKKQLDVCPGVPRSPGGAAA